jgi:hypothetical protein
LDLVTIMADLCDDKKYRFHLAKTTPKGNRPIDALAKSEETLLGWQVYREGPGEDPGSKRIRGQVLNCERIRGHRTRTGPGVRS